MKRIGIFGGTFNPVHYGHLIAAQTVGVELKLDETVFVPCAHPPHKTERELAPAKDRLSMVRLAVRGHKKFSVSDAEIRRGGISYTVDTARHFHRLYPREQIFFIIGEDGIQGLDSWKNIDGILNILSFIAVNREQCPVSSSQIRQRIKRAQSIKDLTPDAIAKYIYKHRLYS